MVKRGGTDNHYHYGVAASLATHYEALFAPVRTRIALTRNPGKAQVKPKAKPRQSISRTIALTRNPGKAQAKQPKAKPKAKPKVKPLIYQKNCDGGMT